MGKPIPGIRVSEKVTGEEMLWIFLWGVYFVGFFLMIFGLAWAARRFPAVQLPQTYEPAVFIAALFWPALFFVIFMIFITKLPWDVGFHLAAKGKKE